jgi:hypothetical protein
MFAKIRADAFSQVFGFTYVDYPVCAIFHYVDTWLLGNALFF